MINIGIFLFNDVKFDIIKYAKTKQNTSSARMRYVMKSIVLNSARVHLEHAFSLHDSVY